MNSFIIHIFCLKSEICTLLKKRLRLDGYVVECTNISEAGDNFLDDFNEKIDCVIMDRDVKIEIKKKVVSRFPDLPIICLPSLDSDVIEVNGITYISEPLKLSELSDIISKIRMSRELEPEK